MMSETDPKILAKIRKCLALSSSTNPNEAAVALRHAQALMRAHGVEAHHVNAPDIAETKTSSRTMSRDKPAHWEAHLAQLVSKAFGCKMFVTKFLFKPGMGYCNEGSYVFIGPKSQSEIASYTAEVLIRKCKDARKKWVADSSGPVQSLSKSKSHLTRLGDAFAEGWVIQIEKLVTDFANPKEVDAAITQHIRKQDVSEGECATRSIPANKIGKVEKLAAYMGIAAAKGESLHRPMNTQAPASRLSHTRRV